MSVQGGASARARLSLIRNIAEVDEVVRALPTFLGVLGAKDLPPEHAHQSLGCLPTAITDRTSWYNDAAGASADTVVAGSPVRVFHGPIHAIHGFGLVVERARLISRAAGFPIRFSECRASWGQSQAVLSVQFRQEGDDRSANPPPTAISATAAVTVATGDGRSVASVQSRQGG